MNDHCNFTLDEWAEQFGHEVLRHNAYPRNRFVIHGPDQSTQEKWIMFHLKDMAVTSHNLMVTWFRFPDV